MSRHEIIIIICAGGELDWSMKLPRESRSGRPCRPLFGAGRLAAERGTCPWSRRRVSSRRGRTLAAACRGRRRSPPRTRNRSARPCDRAPKT